MFEKISWWNLALENTEREALLSAFDNRQLSYGKISKKLEERLAEYLNVKHVMLTTSGSTALLVALKSIGVGPGDEVIIPNRTFQATANAVCMLNATPVVVDVTAVRGLMDLEQVKQKLSNKTKVIIPVHLNGRAVEMDMLMKIAKNANIKIIEDAAQSFASKFNNQFLGTFGDIGCFSMGATKFLATGQGGFVVTNNSNLYEEMKLYLIHAAGDQDQKRFDKLGFNFRLPDLISSIGLSQMNNVSIKYNKFSSVFNYYRSKLEQFEFIKLIDCYEIGELPIWVDCLTSYRDELYNFLRDNKVETLQYYPSISDSKFLNLNSSEFKNSEKFSRYGLVLPSGPDIKQVEIDHVISLLKQFSHLKGIK